MVLLAITACGGTAVVDHLEEGQGGGMVTAASVTAGVSSGGMGGGGGGEPGGAPPIPPLVEVELGDVGLGMPVSFELPDGALGLTAIATPPNPANDVGFLQVAAPDATAIIESYGIAGTLWEFNRQGTVAAAMPITDHSQAMPPMPGSWSFVVESDAPTNTAHLSLWYRQTLDGEFHGGVIDVNFYVVTGAGTESYLGPIAEAALDGFAGLKLGTVRYFGLGNEFSTIDFGNFHDLMSETAGAPGKPALNVMVVDYIDTPNMPLGFSPGAPGNALDDGTYQSGLVMMLSGDFNLDRVVLRHETGHFAGLMHTSEVEAGYGDVLADTPLCPDVPNLLMACPDITNLMFPYADPFNPMLLTTQQSTVVQASALYRGAVEEGGGYAAPLDGESSSDARPWPAKQVRAPSRVSPAASRFLSAHWCGHSPEPWSILASLGATPSALEAMAFDRSLPVYQRARAAAAAARLGRKAGVAPLANDPSEPRALRIAVERALR